MEHDQLAVGGEMDVQLDAVADARGVLKGGDGVLRHALVYAVQSAVGKVAAHEGRAPLLVLLAGRGEEDRSARGGGQDAGGDEPGLGGFI